MFKCQIDKICGLSSTFDSTQMVPISWSMQKSNFRLAARFFMYYYRESMEWYILALSHVRACVYAYIWSKNLYSCKRSHTHKHTRTNMVPSLWFTLIFNGNPINDLICFRHKYWPLQQDPMKYVVPKRQSVRDSNWCTIPPFCWTFPLICRVFNHRSIYRAGLSEL